jgi:uncharacterized protein
VSLQQHDTLLAAVPALLIHRGEVQAASRAGTILFYHGFGESKEARLQALTELAEAGFLAVGLDNAGHGARRLPDFEQHVGNLPPGPELETAFLTLVRATAQEVPSVIDALIARGLATADRIGVAGWSMGGFIAYVAIVADHRIRAAAPMLGSPEWRLPWPESPHRHEEKLFPVALLSQTAADDTRVPPRFARSFHQALAPTIHRRQIGSATSSMEIPGMMCLLACRSRCTGK